MLRRIVLVALFAFCGIAHAQPNGVAALTCTPPTLNTDGSVLTAAQKPLTFKFFEGVVLGTYPNASPPQTSCAYTFTALSVGNHFFVATAIDKLGTSSAMTMAATKTINPQPQPPGALTVGPDPTAFQVIQSDDRVALIPIGTVAPGTACDTAQPILGKFVVPRSAVTWAGRAQPRVVVAACG